MLEQHTDPYGDSALQWATVSMLYGDNEAFIARESSYVEAEWLEAVDRARAAGFLGDIVEKHTDFYEDGNDVANFVIRREATV